MNKIMVIVFALSLFVCLVLVGANYYIKHETSKVKPIVIQEKSQIDYEYKGNFDITWYCISGTTASGNKTNHELTVAADLNYFEFNDVLYIKELKQAVVVHDTGRLVKGHRLDIYTTDCQQAIQNGIKKAKVYKIGVTR